MSSFSASNSKFNPCFTAGKQIGVWNCHETLRTPENDHLHIYSPRVGHNQLKLTLEEWSRLLLGGPVRRTKPNDGVSALLGRPQRALHPRVKTRHRGTNGVRIDPTGVHGREENVRVRLGQLLTQNDLLTLVLGVHAGPVEPIDCRCYNETKKTVWVGATSWYHCVAEDSRISKMPVINPLQALLHPQTQKKLSCMDCQSPTPTSQTAPFLVNRSAD